MYVYGACLFFVSVVVTVWGSVGMFCCVAAVVKNRGFLEPWSVEVCCVFV